MHAQASQSDDVAKAAQAERGLSGALSRLMVVAEQYPELKANDSFNKLMGDLKETEDKIAYSRQFYNDNAMKLNNKIEMFPSNIVAGMFSFKPATFFEVADESEREAVKVAF